MPLKIETVHCGVCHLKTPKSNSRCIHGDHDHTRKEVNQLSNDPKQLTLALMLGGDGEDSIM